MNKNQLYFVFFLSIFARIVFGQTSYTQNQKTDSLISLIKADKPDTNKVNHLIILGNEYRLIGKYETALKFVNEALHLAKSFEFKKEPGCAKGKASAYNNIGNIYYDKGNYYNAIINYIASLKINELLKNKTDIAGSYLNLGIIYYYQNNYTEALKNYNASLNILKEIGDKKGIAKIYTNIGLVYDDPDNYSEALKNHFASLNIYIEIDDKKGIAASYNNIGRIYNDQENYSEALKMYSASLKINEEIGDKYGIAFSYNNIGNIYWNQINYPQTNTSKKSAVSEKLGKESILKKSFLNYFSALKIREQTGDKPGIIESLIGLGNVQLDLKKSNEAQNYLYKALKLSKEIGSKEWIKESYSRIEELDSTQSNWKEAYLHHKLFVVYKDSIEMEEENRKPLQSSMNFDFVKKEEAEIAEIDKKNLIDEVNKKNKHQVLILDSSIIILVIALIVFIFRSKQTRKNKF
jgi:tetratricopeptide (TPR) repeat protein